MSRASSSDLGRASDWYDDFPTYARSRGGQRDRGGQNTRGNTGRGRGGGSTRGNTGRGRGNGQSQQVDHYVDEVFRIEDMDTTHITPQRPSGNTLGTCPAEASKRTAEDMPPQDISDVRNVRRRLNEFDLGELFSGVEATLSKTMDETVAAAPDQLKVLVKKGFSGVMKAVTDMMNGLSDAFQADRQQVETLCNKLDTKVS